eukprot:TRINITY_DN3737_c0_g1_i13.p1 TRINITY_DN3737_c0_g1~~TRINITY_DN3737_c0_g1_i13.p1  ORF type:complete len:148 (-),score=34.03 TRINITY_DN3737_c0_g1_i13:304-747(-)
MYLTQTDPMGLIPSWIVNKATRNFAPKLVENLIRVGPGYPEWKKNNSPNDKPWLAWGKKYWWEEDDTTNGISTPVIITSNPTHNNLTTATASEEEILKSPRVPNSCEESLFPWTPRGNKKTTPKDSPKIQPKTPRDASVLLSPRQRR